jgi:predicted nucleic acid-binding protein
MTRYGIDALTAIRLAEEQTEVPDEHQLVAPTLLRSQALATLYGAVRRGERTRAEARELLDRITTMRIRLLGDRVSRATAWRIAEELDWDDTADAEYVAVAQLQADALVTLDAELAKRIEGIVPLAPFSALGRPSGGG